MSLLTLATPRPGRAPTRRLAPAAAFALHVSILVSLLAASSAPTPLYAAYQAEWGFSAMTVTVLFGVYAVTVLAALLTVGSLSDHVGRRPVLLAALGLQALAMVLFVTAGGTGAVLAARVLQGISTGSAVAALGAGLLDLDKTRGLVANAVGPVTGTATGALVSGLLVAYLPAPEHLVYVLLLAVFALQAVGVVLLAESSAPRPGALASLRPRFALPAATRRPLLVAIPVLVAVWGLAGFYGSLGPALIRLIAGSDSPALGGLALFVLAASAALSVPLMQRTAPDTAMLLGPVALFAGVGVTLLGTLQRSEALFFAGTAIAGIGFGGGFQGSVRTVAPLAAPHERAGVLSVLYVVSYLGLGLPAVVAGYLVVHGGGVLVTAREYGGAVMLLAALALLGLAARRRTTAAAPAVAVPARCS